MATPRFIPAPSPWASTLAASLLPLKDRGRGGAAITVQGHAVSRRHRETRILHLARTRAVLELQDRFGNSIEAARWPAGLAGGQHAAPGVDWKSPLADLAARKALAIMVRDPAQVVELRH